MNAVLISAGGVLIVIGIIVYVYPITNAGSASDINDLCTSAVGQFGKALSPQVRENCQIAKYIVIGSYAMMGIGALLVIVGSVLKHGKTASEYVVEPLGPNAKRTIVIGISVAAAIAIGVVAYQLSLQPNMEVSDLNVSTNPNNQFMKVLDQGRVSESGHFHYTSPQDSSYYIVFSNDFSIISTKYVSVSYTDKGQSFTRTFEVPAGAYKSIPVYAYSGQSVDGSFIVSGGSGNDVDFYIATSTCSQTISFTFNLSNYGPVNGNAEVTLQSDGTSIWSNSYFVESQKRISESGSTIMLDCNQHHFKMVVSSQKRTG